jgi:ribonuclease D
LSILRELVPWRDAVAAELDRATFRVVGNETLLEIARQAPDNRDALAAIKGMPRGMTETRSAEILRAVRRGLDTADDALPRFPKAPRWDRDPDLDDRVARLKVVRDATAARLDLDPGVLCSRERLEAVARRMPHTAAELSAMPELRQWQAAELGPGFLSALWPSPSAAPAPPPTPAPAPAPASDSPYRDE